MGQSSLQVLRGLLSQEGGFGAAFVKRLYAGVAGAAMCSVVVGAVHFAVRGGVERLTRARFRPRRPSLRGGESAETV